MDARIFLRAAVAASLLLLCFVEYASAKTFASTLLWYKTPAGIFNEGLPIGNGRLGANIYGSISKEQIALNEDSFWSGGFRDRVSSTALPAFPTVVNTLEGGDLKAADNLWNSNMTGNPTWEQCFQPAGTMFVDFGHNASLAQNYNRSLDLLTSANTVTYSIGSVLYTRQAIANNPMDALGFRYQANTTGSLNFTLSFTRGQALRSVSADASTRTITLRGGGTLDKTLEFTAKIKLVTTAGTVTASSDGTSLVVSGATDVQVYFDGEGAFRYSSQATWEAVIDSKLNAAITAGWNSFYQQAITDYSALASRVVLDLGNSGSYGVVETRARVANWKKNNHLSTDPELLTLLYNYGRFTLISSSRPGSLPANLQGVWNDVFYPPWSSKYTLNINLEMNYWPAEVTNLPETHLPLFDFMKSMQTRGQGVAREMYGANGWVCHHNADIWGDCAPVDSNTYWSANTMGGAWVSLHLIEHYRFSGNNTFATNVALPILSDSLSFFYDFLILNNRGYYVTSYGASPENAYIVPSGYPSNGSVVGIDQGTAHDRQVLYELFKGFIELSQATGSTVGVAKAQQYLSKIEPPNIGTTGYILEWSKEYTENEPGHRHLSHLLAVYPGAQISPLLNQTLANAALGSLNHRLSSGGGNMGWSRVWAVAIYARLFQGDLAATSITNLLTNYISSNLFDLNGGVFQIDGNLGIVGAVC